MKSRDILAVGSVALDTVKTPFGQAREALGGSATHFAAAARFFSPVHIVAPIGQDFPSKYIHLLKNLKIGLDDLRVEAGKTFRWQGYYGFDLNTARTLKTELNVFETFSPNLSKQNRHRRTVFLANIDPEIQKSVLKQVLRPDLVACDTMNYWIETKKRSLLDLLKKVDIFLCNDAEARQLTSESNLMASSRWILSRGPKIVVIKKGEHGVACFSKNFLFCLPAFLLERVADPTGAGDAFAGGFMGSLSASGRVNEAEIRKAVVYGSVLASYNVERFSLMRLAALRRGEIESRFRLFAKRTCF